MPSNPRVKLPIILIGGPLEWDGVELPDTYQTCVIRSGHLWWVVRDWVLDRWTGTYQGEDDGPDHG